MSNQCTPRSAGAAQECIPTSLLKLGADSSGRAVKMFAAVQRYMGDVGDPPTGAAKLDLIAKLLSQARLAADIGGNPTPNISSPSSVPMQWDS